MWDFSIKQWMLSWFHRVNINFFPMQNPSCTATAHLDTLAVLCTIIDRNKGRNLLFVSFLLLLRCFIGMWSEAVKYGIKLSRKEFRWALLWGRSGNGKLFLNYTMKEAYGVEGRLSGILHATQPPQQCPYHIGVCMGRFPLKSNTSFVWGLFCIQEQVSVTAPSCKGLTPSL